MPRLYEAYGNIRADSSFSDTGISNMRNTTIIGGGGGGSSPGNEFDRPAHGGFAEGSDDFFCIATIGRGDPPKVTVQGRGLDAKVTVGKQTVRFDGEKIIFGN